MSDRVTMPTLGESVTEGTVTRWLKSVGDEVAVDEPLLEVSTDKVDTEVPSPFSGTLVEILVPEDETVEIGTDLAVIGDASEASSAPAEEGAPEPAAPAEESAPAEEAAAAAPAGEVSGGQEVKMPALGESVTEGTITRWLKEEGEEVAVDEPLLEVSTDKVDTEVPSPFAGKLTKILAAEDESVAVGGVLAIIGGEAAAAAPAEEAPAPVKEAPAAPAKEAAAAPADSADSGAAAYVTPLVRKLAAQHGVDLSKVKGSGIGGRIRKQDVLEAAKPAPAPQAPAAAAPAPAAAAAPAAAPEVKVSEKRGTREKMTRLRKVIAQRMNESLQISAQLTSAVEVDITRVAQLRAKNKDAFLAREGVKLTYLPFISLATVEALKQFPELNCQVEGEEIVYPAAEHLGIAVDTPRGLLVPVIKDAGDLNIAGIARKISDLASRTRDNKVTPDELGGGTFTITNIGSNGSIIDTPIINQPQVGILGTGAIVKRAVVVTDELGNDSIAIRHMMFLTLTYDHRVVDGGLAGRFLTTIKKRLEGGAFEI
ncbi:Dihydrolipoyllysine-residue succinyltransferase component of 2-oxoglutarate dehydrogenase complex [Dermatophilus congolensis]|uniref:Dihydrolipoamide acetyltransferase component of pyruvate dehydrogenase complex n=1 Tax=Dermatophilus congolensis TaxID=1863 RepID=A0AA46H0G9_9MICO|nr:2-oxoglutarate dehydrogenase, E2 component, dihydrolipoamide succinyltransferase [Dermatophilus congolensis]STD09379.1 Dihydrolipoyllysine-residue succinyltransferase component of 2-oxoglutarate dehydrogenase complex [Dermatophilus congolensis]